MIGSLLYGAAALLLPGLLLSLVAYPGKEQLDPPSRLAMSLGLGVLLDVYLGFLLARIGRLSAFPLLLPPVCAGLAAAAFLRGAYLLSPPRREAAGGS